MTTFFAYSNPYYDQGIFGFFWVLIQRLWLGLQGRLSIADIVTDELQIIVLSSVAVSAALVGSFLVFRKMTMLANALSHTILVGIVLAYLFFKGTQGAVGDHYHHSLSLGMLFAAALVTGLVTTFFTEFLSKVLKLQEDASIGIVFTSLFAMGIILVTLLTRNVHIGAEVVMGNVDALHLDDLKLVGMILLMNVVVIFFFFKEFQLTTFDPSFAKAIGVSTLIFHYLLMMQASATVIGAFRAVGVIMVLAFLTAPTLTARLMTHRLKPMLAIASVIGVLASVLGVAISRHLFSTAGFALSTGGIVVCVLVVFYMAAASVYLFRHS